MFFLCLFVLNLHLSIVEGIIIDKKRCLTNLFLIVLPAAIEQTRLDLNLVPEDGFIALQLLQIEGDSG